MTPAPPPSPYKGLAPFEDSELDALFFFGRERERDLITANLLASRLTVLYGATGVGKSSLLRAGVAHQLGKTERVAVASSWSEDPVGVLESAAAEAEEGELFLILDQLEEFFVYHGPNGVTGEFAASLAELVLRPDLRLSVLLGIREESLAKLDAFKARLPNVLGNYLRLEHLARSAAREAIVAPLQRYTELSGESCEIEPALVEAVLDEVAAERIGDASAPPGGIETPYLQLVMQRVWEVERAEGSSLLRLDTLRALGGAERIVREHLERALSVLSPAQRDAAARMFDHLVTPSGAKVALAVDDLVSYAGIEDPAAHGVIARLEGQRILRPVEGAKVEIFHDVLAGSVSAWRRDHEAGHALRRARRRARRLAALATGALVALAAVSVVALYALSQRREAREQAEVARAQAALALEQQQLQREARQEADLARAGLAKEAERAQAKEEEAARLATSARASAAEAARQAERARQQERAALASGDLAAAEAARAKANEQEALHQAALAQLRRSQARREAIRAEARGLLARATARLDSNSEQSVRLALEASLLERSPRAESVLRSALAAHRLRAVLPGGGGGVRAAVFSPDSRLVAIAAAGGQARLFSRSGRLMRVLPHGSEVTSAAFSPDGRTLATGARDGRVRLWDVKEGGAPRVVRHRAPLTAVAFTPDGETVVTAGEDGVVRTWDTGSGDARATMRHAEPVRSISIHPGGRLLLTATRDTAAHVFNLVTGAEVAELEQLGEVGVAAFSPDGKVAVTGGERNAYIWETGTWEPAQVLEGHTSRLTGLAFSPDGDDVMTISDDSTARLWQISTGRLLHAFTGLHRRRLNGGAVSARGDSFATASRDRTVGLWTTPFTVEPFRLTGHRGPVRTVVFSPDSWSLLSASDDGTARLWRARDPALGLLADAGRVDDAEFSPDGRLAVTASDDGTARVWSSTGRLVGSLGHGGAVTDVAFGRGGRIATASEDGKARLWRSDGSLLAALAHGSPVRAVAITPGGLLAATGGDDGRVLVFGGSGNLVEELRQGAPVRSLAFSSSGALISGGKDGSIYVWDVREAERRATLKRHRGAVVSLAFGPRGLLVSASADGTAHVYDLRSGRFLRELQGHAQPLTSAVFSPDGRLVLTASADDDARTWSVRTGRLVRVFHGHTSTVHEARFSPDGRWVVTGGPSAAGIWEAATGKLLFFLRGHKNAVRAVSFAPGGRRVLTASTDGTLRSWRCDLCGRLPALQAIARARLVAIARGGANAYELTPPFPKTTP